MYIGVYLHKYTPIYINTHLLNFQTEFNLRIMVIYNLLGLQIYNYIIHMIMSDQTSILLFDSITMNFDIINVISETSHV